MGSYFFSFDDTTQKSGAAYVYHKEDDGILWTEQQQLIAADTESDDNFGISVAICKDIIVVGAEGGKGNGVDSGSAYVFMRQNGVWEEQAKLLPSDGASHDEFGFSVDVWDSTVLVGAYFHEPDVTADTKEGAAYIFSRDGGGVWSQAAKLTAEDAPQGAEFGRAVTLSNGVAVVGAHFQDAIYIFNRSEDGSWSNEKQIKVQAPEPMSGEFFGFAVAADQENLAVGAYLHERGDPVKQAGSVYLFTTRPEQGAPTRAPTTPIPTNAPVLSPTINPNYEQSQGPTPTPSHQTVYTLTPITSSSVAPSASPSNNPSRNPSQFPSQQPIHSTPSPSVALFASSKPSQNPSQLPSMQPIHSTQTLSTEPTKAPTTSPTTTQDSSPEPTKGPTFATTVPRTPTATTAPTPVEGSPDGATFEPGNPIDAKPTRAPAKIPTIPNTSTATTVPTSTEGSPDEATFEPGNPVDVQPTEAPATIPTVPSTATSTMTPTLLPDVSVPSATVTTVPTLSPDALTPSTGIPMGTSNPSPPSTPSVTSAPTPVSSEGSPDGATLTPGTPTASTRRPTTTPLMPTAFSTPNGTIAPTIKMPGSTPDISTPSPEISTDITGEPTLATPTLPSTPGKTVSPTIYSDSATTTPEFPVDGQPTIAPATSPTDPKSPTKTSSPTMEVSDGPTPGPNLPSVTITPTLAVAKGTPTGGESTQAPDFPSGTTAPTIALSGGDPPEVSTPAPGTPAGAELTTAPVSIPTVSGSTAPTIAELSGTTAPTTVTSDSSTLTPRTPTGVESTESPGFSPTDTTSPTGTIDPTPENPTWVESTKSPATNPTDPDSPTASATPSSFNGATPAPVASQATNAPANNPTPPTTLTGTIVPTVVDSADQPSDSQDLVPLLDIRHIYQYLQPGGIANEHFGFSVAKSGKYAAIGAPLKGRGVVYVYRHDEDSAQWFYETTLTPPAGSILNFGEAVAISDKSVIVGARNDIGVAYVFTRVSRADWSLNTELQAPGVPSPGRVVLDVWHTTIVFGVSSTTGGAAFVYTKRSGISGWTESAKLVPEDADGKINFAWSVSVYDHTIACGSGGSQAGSVYIYKGTFGQKWTNTDRISPNKGSKGDKFGSSVSMYEGMIIIGASGDSEGAGAVYIFEEPNLNNVFLRQASMRWTLSKKLTALDRHSGMMFGSMVMVGEKLVIVGSPSDESVYVFSRENGNIVMEDQLKLKTPSMKGDSYFGVALALDGDYLLVGAHLQRRGSARLQAGSAYLYDMANLEVAQFELQAFEKPLQATTLAPTVTKALTARPAKNPVRPLRESTEFPKAAVSAFKAPQQAETEILEVSGACYQRVALLWSTCAALSISLFSSF